MKVLIADVPALKIAEPNAALNLPLLLVNNEGMKVPILRTLAPEIAKRESLILHQDCKDTKNRAIAKKAFVLKIQERVDTEEKKHQVLTANVLVLLKIVEQVVTKDIKNRVQVVSDLVQKMIIKTGATLNLLQVETEDMKTRNLVTNDVKMKKLPVQIEKTVLSLALVQLYEQTDSLY